MTFIHHSSLQRAFGKCRVHLQPPAAIGVRTSVSSSETAILPRSAREVEEDGLSGQL